ncbi:pseudouridylate synthase RPUSD2-like isoform X1 [Chironomus tepperi]|uniref:pseudouridylate synthase RPUSD2-like isoform X1 n=1 Tax=Chironomus tepperi TaxID=113505 RepID=UPI00391F9BF2
MQHHPGSWYLGPWGVPLQKMLAVPFNPAAAGYQPSQISGAAVAQTTSQGPPQQAQSQQPSHPYSAAAHHHPLHQAMHHNHAAAAIHQQLNQQLHPAAAAAMFTPLTLRSFVTHPHLNLSQQQIPTGAQPQQPITSQTQSQLTALNLNNVGVVPVRQTTTPTNTPGIILPMRKILMTEKEKAKLVSTEKRKAAEETEDLKKDLKKAKLETKALKAKRPGFTDDRYYETSYYIENGLRKVYPYYFTFTTFTKGRWVGEKILDVFAREFRAHPAEEYERCIKAGTLTVNYEKVPIEYKLKHNDLLANVVHRHEVPVTSQPITIVFMDDDIVVVNKPASIPVHPCGRYRHNTVVFILAKEYNLKNLRTIHRLDRLTSGLLLFGRSPKKARQMEHQIRNRQVQKQYICRVEGEFPEGVIECKEPIEVVSYKIGVCKVSPKGKDCTTTFEKLGYNGDTSVVLCKPLTGRMHQIRVHLQYLGYPVVNDPLYNHDVFGPNKGKGGDIGGKTDEQLVRDLINIHNAENWLGIDGDSDLSMFNKSMSSDLDDSLSVTNKGNPLSDDDCESVSREASPCSESPRPVSVGSESPNENICTMPNQMNNNNNNNNNNKIINSSNVQLQSGNGRVTREQKVGVTVATQTGHESPDLTFNPDKMTTDKHCYECKVRYKDPKPQDLVMYLHAWKYKGPGWDYETELPEWARVDWKENE